VDAATPRADDPGPFTCCVAHIAINALPCQVGAASFFPSGNQVVRLPVSGPGLPDRMRLASQGSFDGHPWLWLPIKNHGKGSCAILTHRPCTIGLTRRKLQRPPQVIAVCWHPPSGLGYCPRPSPRARPSSVAPGDFPAASPRLPHPFHKCGFGVAAVQHGRWSDVRTRTSEQHIRLNTDAKLVITTQSLNFTHADLKNYKSLMLLYGIELARWPADRQ